MGKSPKYFALFLTLCWTAVANANFTSLSNFAIGSNYVIYHEVTTADSTTQLEIDYSYSIDEHPTTGSHYLVNGMLINIDNPQQYRQLNNACFSVSAAGRSTSDCLLGEDKYYPLPGQPNISARVSPAATGTLIVPVEGGKRYRIKAQVSKDILGKEFGCREDEINCLDIIPSRSANNLFVKVRQNSLRIDNLAFTDKVYYPPKKDQNGVVITPAMVDYEDLEFLSYDEHNYYNGTNRIYGSFRVAGPPGTEIENVTLLVLNGSTSISSVNLDSGAASTAVIGTIGQSGFSEITDNSTLLFEIPAAAYVSDNLGLQLLATTTSGTQVKSKVTRYTALKNFAHGKSHIKRFGGRDETTNGGDDWSEGWGADLIDKLSVQYPTIHFNDASDMNGGKFPPHKSHGSQVVVDAYFPGLPAKKDANGKRRADGKSAAAAQFIVTVLNDPFWARHIKHILTTYTTNNGDAFNSEIKRSTVLDSSGNPIFASQKIIPYGEHKTHMHIHLRN